MKNSELLTALGDFGFTDQQAKLYVAGLSLGETLMARLAREAKVKRSSAYYAISELERRGFFSIKKVGKRTYYRAASPQQLITMTTKRLETVKKLFPQLKKLQKITPK